MALAPSDLLDMLTNYEVPLEPIDDILTGADESFLHLLLALDAIGEIFKHASEETKRIHETQIISTWPAVFKWSAFFCTSSARDIDVDSPYLFAMASRAISWAWIHLGYSDKISEVITSTHGTVEIATKMWLIEGSVTPPPRFVASLLLMKLLNNDPSPKLRDRVISAAGGAPIVATTAIRRLNDALTQQIVNDWAYVSCVSLLHHLSLQEYPLERLLLDAGAIIATTRGLIRTAEELNSGEFEYSSHRHGLIDTLTSGFMYLSKTLEAGTGLFEIGQAIDAGIIEAFVESSPFFTLMPAENWTSVEEIFDWVIPKYLVYGSVIRAVSENLCRLPDTPRLQNIRHTPAWKAFQFMRKLTLERLLVKKYAKRTSICCGNEKCEEVKLKEKFLECSSCHTARYCSAACQKADWKSGHRSDCEGFRQDYVSKHPEAYGKRDKIWFELVAIYYAGFQLPELRKTTRREYPNNHLSQFTLIIDFCRVPPSFTLRIFDERKDDSTTSSQSRVQSLDESDQAFIAKEGARTPVFCYLPCGNYGKGFIRSAAGATSLLWGDGIGREPFTGIPRDCGDSEAEMMDLLQEIAPMRRP
ncbi:hypothetical protein BDN72DRAFT_895299 [Pluteus cervinus]|uniref:Uncharacterized protein n=1 Tax=Pluteus cervinus TaxID=181527 RepID=A0ACD3B1L3_9AGAR|nr:hypothetical protein BDN72DRAFT_895299 [Pluteus cervinus]